MIRLSIPPRTAIALLCLLIAACSKPQAEQSGFLQQAELLKEDRRVPFSGYWSSGTDLRQYKKIAIAPVDTTHLLKMDWWQKFVLAEAASPEAEVKYLAGRWRDKLIDKFKAENGYQVVDEPDDQTLVIELALIEVVPTKVWLNTIGYALVGALDNGTTAMEGRMRVGPRMEPIVLFKDAEHGQYSLLSLADLSWYSHSEHTIDHWTDQFVELCTSAPDAHISSASRFTLRPW